MGGSNPQRKSIKYYKLKAKADETNTPAFVENTKVGNSWEQGTPFSTMSGMLTGAKIKEKEYEGVKSNLFVLTFVDENETSQVEFTHNAITHSIINCLSGMEDYMSDISIYVGKKLDKTTNKVWPESYVNTNLALAKPDMVRWAFDPKTAPAKEPVLMQNGEPFMQNGKAVKDDSKLKAFFEEVFLRDVAGKFGTATQEPSEKARVMNENAHRMAEGVEEENDGDPLPF